MCCRVENHLNDQPSHHQCRSQRIAQGIGSGFSNSCGGRRVHRSGDLPHARRHGQSAEFPDVALADLAAGRRDDPQRCALLWRTRWPLPSRRRKLRLSARGFRRPGGISVRVDVSISHGSRPLGLVGDWDCILRRLHLPLDTCHHQTRRHRRDLGALPAEHCEHPDERRFHALDHVAQAGCSGIAHRLGTRISPRLLVELRAVRSSAPGLNAADGRPGNRAGGGVLFLWRQVGSQQDCRGSA